MSRGSTAARARRRSRAHARRTVNDPDEVGILARNYAMLRAQALNSEAVKGLLERLQGE
ncbi:hypothetical protein V2S66_30600 [Streptomyces sp. V4-01]|uniref:Uncharacterized protein n=1 Tax=Actinacidiphila polyblastidii TaxID=3110430 RepID=A0ABU7PKT6_9ACTN|nr:hypothetical protein [Streptomyces sp. V4-01]